METIKILKRRPIQTISLIIINKEFLEKKSGDTLKQKKPIHLDKLLIGYCKCKELILYNLFYYQFFFCLEF